MTTLISNVTELTNWLNSPSGTGQLTANITINATTWTIPAGILTAGMILDGNGKIIFLENTTGSNYGSWPGLLKMNGGTIQNLKMSGSTSNNAAISPSENNCYFTNYYTNGTTANYDTVFFDGCVSNYLYLYGNIDVASVFGARTAQVNLNNCQMGRSKTDPMVKSGGSFAGMALGLNTFTITNCVFYGRVNGGSDIGVISGIQSSGTISNCITYMYVSNYGTYCAVMFGARLLGNITVTNCYQFIDWGISSYSYALPIMITSENTGVYTMNNSYTLINLVGSGSFASGNPVINLSTGSTSNFTNVAYTGGFNYAAGGTINLTNCMNTYTSSTPNSTEPINSFSASIWDKTVTPPTLKFNNTSPWGTAYNAYNTPNSISLFQLTPVITWVPSPSTLLYPSPLTTKQLNATSDVAGTFTYNPVLGTILNIGASQTLNATFVPTDPSYNTVYPTATVSVVQAPYMYIFNQNDLYNFLYTVNATTVVKGLFVNNIDISVDTWYTTPSRTFATGRILDGNGYILNISGSGGKGLSNVNYGLIVFGGGTFRNCTITTTLTSSQAYPRQNLGIVAGASNNGILEFIKIVDTDFNLNDLDSRAYMVGSNCNFIMNSCQVGSQTNRLNLGSNNTGAFGPQGFTGTFNNCIAYVNGITTQGLNGGFIGTTGGNVSFNKCLVNGTLSDTVSGIQGGFISKANHTVTFNNCYSLVNVSGVLNGTGGGYIGGGTTNNTKIFFNNCYYLGTDGNSGTLVNGSTNPFVLSLYNVAANSNYLSNPSLSTNVLNDLVVQKFTNSLSQNGVAGGTIYDMVVIGSDIYIGGSFTSVNGDSGIQYLAKWTSSTSSWGSVGGGVINNTVYSLSVLGSTLYIGGAFTAPSSKITTWNGTSFTGISAATFNGVIRTVYPQSSTNVFIGGDFTLMNGATNMRRIGYWNGSAWNELGVSGLSDGIVYSIVSGGSTNNIFFGGSFTSSTNVTPGTMNRLGYASTASPFFSVIGTGTGGGVNDTVYTLVNTGSTLYIGGAFTTTTSGTTVNRWAQQTTGNLANAINAIGSGTVGFGDGQVNKIIVDSGILYAAGSFTLAGGYTMKGLAKYNASASGRSVWSSTANYLDNNVQSMVIYLSTLYIGGTFANLEDVSATDEITNLGGLAQIPFNYNIVNYSATGQPSLTTPPILAYNTYFTS